MQFTRRFKDESKGLLKPDETLYLRLEGSLEGVAGLTWHEERDEDGHGEELHGQDLYSVFRSTAEYLGYDTDVRHTAKDGITYGVGDGLWGMNFAGFLQLHPTAIAEFQVGLNRNFAGENSRCSGAIPQFFQCAGMSLERFGVFEPRKIELTYEPGEARWMLSRLISSLGLFRSHDPAHTASVRVHLGWHADPNDPELDLEFSFTSRPIDPFRVEFENQPTQGKAEAGPPLSPFHLTATATMPEFSLNCIGWLVSFLISGLAPAGAKDIRIRLEPA